MTRNQTVEEIFEGLNQFKRFIHSYAAPSMAKLKLSRAQLEVLMTLAHVQPISHKALAAKMQLTPGAISQLLDALDSAGCITRTTSPSDRRVSYLSLSRTGKKRLDELNALRKKMFTSAFESLNEQELQSYLKVQKKLLAWLEQNQPTNAK